MRVPLPATFLVLLALAFGSAATAQEAIPGCPGDVDCSDAANVVDKTKEKAVDVMVFSNGAVEYPCLKVQRNRTTINWKINAADTRSVDVEFKDCVGGDPPKKPTWDSAKLKRTVRGADLGTAKACGYVVTVTGKSGKTVRCDPKLIVNP